MNELTIGSVIRDTYRLERHIGAGAMGTVYAASHVRSAERFAIKVLRGLAVNNPRAVARFEQEASAISSIAHPHLVEVFEYGRSKAGVPYIVMELLEGHDLARRLDQRGRFAPREAVSLLVQTAAALQAVHEAGIVHRDLKPTNIFLCRRGDRDDFVKLLDFGISKVLGSAVDETGTNQVLGTPRFMSPEQATGKAASVDQRSDVFSLAAIGFEVLSGEPAFLGEGAMQSMYRVVNHEPPPLDEIAPVAKSLARVIARALSKEPRARPGSAEQLARELMHAMKLAPSDDDELAWLETSDIRRTMAWTTSGMTTDPLGDGATLVALSDVTADTTLPPVTAVAIDHASGDPPVGERVTTELVPVPSAPPAVLHGAPTLSLDPARDDGDRAGVKAHVQPKAAPVIPAPPAQPAIPAPPPTRALNVKLLALAAALLLFAVSLLLVLLLDRPADVTRKRAGAAAQARRVDGAPALADALPVDSASAVASAPAPRDATPRAPATRATVPAPNAIDAAVTRATAALPATPRADARVSRPRTRPRARVQPLRRPPRVRRAPLRGKLRVVTSAAGEPVWANVFVDGKPVGQSALVLELRVGRHLVSVRRDGFVPQSRRVRVESGRAAIARFALRRRAAP